jgi:hypothetical protein
VLFFVDRSVGSGGNVFVSMLKVVVTGFVILVRYFRILTDLEEVVEQVLRVV